MLHAAITRYGVVRGTNRELVDAAAMVLSPPVHAAAPDTDPEDGRPEPAAA